MVNYNGGDTLHRCLDSLVKATEGFSSEIVLVDNASIDGSVDEVPAQYPEIKLVINKKNMGFSKANNIALQQSSGEYVLVLNSDTIVDKPTIESALSKAREIKNLGVYSLKLKKEDRSIQKSTGNFPSILNMVYQKIGIKPLLGYEPDLNVMLNKVDWVSGAFMVIPRSVIEKAGFFDERYFLFAEDMDLCKKYRDCGYEILYDTTQEITHVSGGSSQKTPVEIDVAHYVGSILYYQKNNGFVSSVVYRLMLIFFATPTLFWCILKNKNHKKFSLLIRATIRPNYDFLHKVQKLTCDHF